MAKEIYSVSPPVSLTLEEIQEAFNELNVHLLSISQRLLPDSSCRVRLRATQAIPTGVWTKLQFDYVEWDIQNEWDSTNYRFVAKGDGKYLVCATGYIVSLGDADTFSLASKKNGSYHGAYARDVVGAANGSLITLSCIVELNREDYIEIFTHHDYGSSRNAEAGEHYNNLSIMRINKEE